MHCALSPHGAPTKTLAVNRADLHGQRTFGHKKTAPGICRGGFFRLIQIGSGPTVLRSFSRFAYIRTDAGAEVPPAHGTVRTASPGSDVGEDGGIAEIAVNLRVFGVRTGVEGSG